MISAVFKTLTVLVLVVLWITFGLLDLKIKKAIKFTTMVLVVLLQLVQCFVLRQLTTSLIFQQILGVLTLIAFWLGTRMCVVALTGGIACGKSTVCEQLK
jgi:hypothetical protein